MSNSTIAGFAGKRPSAFFVLLFSIFALALQTGCATIGQTPYYVEVSSLAAPEAARKRTYVILPGNKDTDPSDLLFTEFATYVSRALNANEFVAAEKADGADLAVVLFYGIGDPKVNQVTYTLPIWGKTGVSSSYTSGTVNAIGNTATYNETTTYSPSYGITGYSTQVENVTTYFRFVDVVGYDLELFRNSNRQVQLWKTMITSTGTSGDLRRLFPIMIGTATPHIGKDTKQRLSLTAYESSPEVLVIKDAVRK